MAGCSPSSRSSEHSCFPSGLLVNETGFFRKSKSRGGRRISPGRSDAIGDGDRWLWAALASSGFRQRNRFLPKAGFSRGGGSTTGGGLKPSAELSSHSTLFRSSPDPRRTSVQPRRLIASFALLSTRARPNGPRRRMFGVPRAPTVSNLATGEPDCELKI